VKNISKTEQEKTYDKINNRVSKCETTSFKVGDWVVLREKYVEREIKKYPGAREILEKFSKPQKIQAIYFRDIWPYRELIEFPKNENWSLFGNEFRLATEREIKEYELKCIFLQS
jgi:hypothetical protein